MLSLATALRIALLASALAVWPLEGQQRSDRASAAARPGTAARVLAALRVDAPPAIDGRLDDPVWARAQVARDFVQFQPDPGAGPRQQTEARVLFDDDALYVGIRAWDTAPDSIVGRLARRDETPFSDWLFVTVDGYYDRRTAFSFGVNPRGVEQDGRYAQDTSWDPGWDAVWEVATTVDSLGWTAEFRIPLSQFRFSGGSAGGQRWGVNFRRLVARHDEVSDWSPVPAGGGQFVSRAGDLVGLDVSPRRRLEIQPYTLAGVTAAPGDPANPFHSAAEMNAAAGADIRYGVTSDLTLALTLNPDFGQVEADPSVVNLSGFETFFPERRPFFLEGAEIFQPTFPSFPAMVHTRRIGRTPQGAAPGAATFSSAPDATTILGAAKLTGKAANGWSVGLFDAVTAREDVRFVLDGGSAGRRTAEPLTNYAAVRVARDLRGGQSAAGVLATATNRRLPATGELDFLTSSAYVLGLDGRHRFPDGDWEVAGSVFGSHVRGTPDAIERIQRSSVHRFDRPDAEHLTFDPARTSLTGWAAALNVEKLRGHWRFFGESRLRSPAFEVNDLGFLGRADRIQYFVRGWYDGYTPGPLFRSWRLNVAHWQNRNFGGQRSWTGANAWFDFRFHNQWGGTIGTWYDLPRLDDDELRGGPALYGGAEWGRWLNVSSDPRRAVSGHAFAQLTSAAERELREFRSGGQVTMRPAEQMDLSLGPEFTRRIEPVQFVANREAAGRLHYLRGRIAQTTLALTMRASYTFSPDLSLQLYAQPFVSAGAYSRFSEVADPAARAFDARFRFLADDEIAFDPGAGTYAVDLDRDGTGDLAFPNPDFNVRQFRSNVVLRWEYRPGSTIFFVWARGQADFTSEGRFDVGRDVGALFGAEPTDTFLVKLSYWLSP